MKFEKRKKDFYQEVKRSPRISAIAKLRSRSAIYFQMAIEISHLMKIEIEIAIAIFAIGLMPCLVRSAILTHMLQIFLNVIMILFFCITRFKFGIWFYDNRIVTMQHRLTKICALDQLLRKFQDSKHYSDFLRAFTTQHLPLCFA